VGSDGASTAAGTSGANASAGAIYSPGLATPGAPGPGNVTLGSGSSSVAMGGNAATFSVGSGFGGQAIVDVNGGGLVQIASTGGIKALQATSGSPVGFPGLGTGTAKVNVKGPTGIQLSSDAATDTIISAEAA